MRGGVLKAAKIARRGKSSAARFSAANREIVHSGVSRGFGPHRVSVLDGRAVIRLANGKRWTKKVAHRYPGKWNMEFSPGSLDKELRAMEYQERDSHYMPISEWFARRRREWGA